jgi:hypothetical protein
MELHVMFRYFPPDFDPADLPKGQRGKDNAMKVRMMLPMTVRCQTCGEFMYKGTKFNCKKEDVVDETYLGIQIFRFYMRCRKCSAEITYLTDPQNRDYKMEHGATRNFEHWKEEQSIEEALKARREAEDEDKVKRLENKTADAKRELDMMGMLDDMLHSKGQHAKVSTEEAIAALKARSEAEAAASGRQIGDLTAEDEQALEQLVASGVFTQRVDDDADISFAGGDGRVKRLAGAPLRRAPRVKVRKVSSAQTNASVQEADPNEPEGAGQGSRQPCHTVAPVAPVAPKKAASGCASAKVHLDSTGGLGLIGYGGSSSSGDEPQIRMNEPRLQGNGES